MRSRRLAILVGAAFLAGLVVAAALLSPASPVAPAMFTEGHLLVELANTGTRDALLRVNIEESSGRGVATWTWDMPSGRTRTQEVDTLQHDLVVRVAATVEGSVGASFSRVVDPTTCGAEGIVVVSLVLETTRGVTFRDAGKPLCA